MQELEVFINSNDIDSFLSIEGFVSPWEYSKHEQMHAKDDEFGRLRIGKKLTLKVFVNEKPR